MTILFCRNRLWVKAGFFAICYVVAIADSPAFADSNGLLYPLRSDWSQSGGETNLSAFVYNDLNESGDYDLGDRAMAGIAVRLDQNSIPQSAARSNINGFANFAASTSNPDAPLSEPGTYDFAVIVPPGWRATTGNEVQTRQLMLIEGSNAGLGFAEMLHPIGLTRYKFIRGTYSGATDGHLILRRDGLLVTEADLAPAEQFLWPVGRGDYTLEVSGIKRPVSVSDNPVDIGQIGLRPAADSSGTIIDFEGIAPSGLKKVQNGYGGLNWFNLNAIRSDTGGGGIGYTNGASSGNHVLYTSSGHPATIYADAPLDFLSVNLTAAWPESEGEEAVFTFYRDNTLLLQDSVGLSAYGPITYQPMVQGVTRIEVSTVHYWQLVIDDITVSLAR